MSAGPVVTLDVGNSRVKAAVFPGGAVDEPALLVSGATHDQAGSLVDELRAHVPKAGRCRVVVSCVAPAHWRSLAERLVGDGRFAEPAVFANGSDVFAAGLIAHDLTTPETTGPDRLLAAVAATAWRPGTPNIVVTAGTAVTVNLTDSRGRFRGGAILPGFGVAAAALAGGTAALPLVALTTPPPPLGRSTVAALQSGIHHAVCAAVDRLVEEYAALADGPADVYLTGGGAALLGEGMQASHTLVPNLVLRGLRHAAEPRRQVAAR